MLITRSWAKAGALTALAVVWFFFFDTFRNDISGLHLRGGCGARALDRAVRRRGGRHRAYAPRPRHRGARARRRSRRPHPPARAEGRELPAQAPRGEDLRCAALGGRPAAGARVGHEAARHLRDHPGRLRARGRPQALLPLRQPRPSRPVEASRVHDLRTTRAARTPTASRTSRPSSTWATSTAWQRSSGKKSQDVRPAEDADGGQPHLPAGEVSSAIATSIRTATR